jgi:hypothetical protein
MLNLSTNDIINSIFDIGIFTLLFAFVCNYFIAYLLSLVFYSSRDEEGMLIGRGFILNILIYLMLFLNLISFGGSPDINIGLSNILTKFKNFLNDQSSIFSVLSFIFFFYLIVYLVGVPMTNSTKPSSISFIDTLAWLLFIIVLISDFFNIFLNTSIFNSLLSGWINNLHDSDVQDNSHNDLSNNHKKDTSSNFAYSSHIGDEVFNISNNLYTYNDAKEVCSIYGAKLATYDQVEEAYNKGGEWCNYGWSDGQMALFPTQKATWSKLQKSETTKNQCGRPGVNGGFMGNDGLLFGVNCFGKKPHATDKELQMMAANKNIDISDAATPEEAAKIKFLKENKDTLLVLNPFARGDWSEW